jgi:hypothetical protein
MEAQGLNGATATGLRLREDCFSERGPDATERERAHRTVSPAADSEAELTVALDEARTRRWSQNRQWSTAGGCGALCTRGQSERKGERVWHVAEPPELFQLKCLSPALEARPHLNRNNMSVPQI